MSSAVNGAVTHVVSSIAVTVPKLSVSGSNYNVQQTFGSLTVSSLFTSGVVNFE